jgi:DNA polymerase-4
MARYAEVSKQVMAVLESFTPLLEQLSVDEAFLDVRGALRQWGDAVTLARALKETMRERLGLTASVGVATNKFLAKLASDLEKPDGLTVIPPWEARERLADEPLVGSSP